MKVGAFVLNYKRPDTAPKTVDSLLHQTIPLARVYIFNNNPDTIINYPGCVNINSQENLGCIIRHMLAITRDFDYCLFVDDDVVLRPGAIENFLRYAERYPDSVLGYYGRNLIKDPNILYTMSVGTFLTNKEMEVDVVLGMVHFCRPAKLINSLIISKSIPDLPLTEDDIILSLGNKYIDKAKNYIIPYDNSNGPISLNSEHKGLSASPGHLERRRDAVRRILTWAGELR